MCSLGCKIKKRIYVIFFISLIFILISGTTSQAYVSKEYINWAFENLNNENVTLLKQKQQDTINLIANDGSIKTDIYNHLIELQNQNNIQDLEDVNLQIFVSDQETTLTRILFIFSNAGVPGNVENLGFLEIKYNYSVPVALGNVSCRGSSQDKIYIMILSYKDSFSYQNKILTGSSNLNTPYIYANFEYNDDLSVVTSKVGSFAGIPSIYMPYPFSSSGTIYPMIITSTSGNYKKQEQPELPPEESGDTGGGNTGNITNPSGDITGNIDLSGIEQGIGNINQNLENIEDKIPTSGDIKDSTTAGVIAGNNSYWGNSGDMNHEDYENQINNGLNDSIDDITETLENNEVFDSIAIAEQKVIDLFLEEPEDFKISWNDVFYENTKLIPSGEVNFSKICRENEALGRVKSTLNIIISAMISFALFKQIYNLILVTLGIDSPFILEKPLEDEITYTTDEKGRTYEITRGFNKDGTKYVDRRRVK